MSNQSSAKKEKGELEHKKIQDLTANKGLQNIKIFSYGVTDSTNTRAREYARASKEKEPCVFIADGQSAGRGRLGRSFDSKKNAGLYVSFLFYPKQNGVDAVKITRNAAVIVCRVLESLYGICAKIKWVNDIYINGKKAAGILTEGEIDAEKGSLNYAVCGIGINLNKRVFSEELADIATTLEDAMGKKADRDELAARLIFEFFSLSEKDDLIDDYRKLSLVTGRTVCVKSLSGEEYAAFAEEITDVGLLRVRRDDGTYEELCSADVSVKV